MLDVATPVEQSMLLLLHLLLFLLLSLLNLAHLSLLESYKYCHKVALTLGFNNQCALLRPQ